jgi:hypothetical protein
MSGGQAIVIAAGFVAAVFALGMGAGMLADWLRAKKKEPQAMQLTDNFNGDTPHLIRCIEALLKLDAAGALVPHRLPGHARTLLEAAAIRLGTNGVAPTEAGSGA